jgi:hypothetical protein
MLRGRDEHHHAQALTRLARAALAVAVVTAAMGGASASTEKISVDGVVHSVEESPWSSAQQSGGTELRHTRQHADGVSDSLVITGTADLAIDLDPVIDLDPASGEPIAVWTRNEGAGFGLYVSRFDGAAWSAPKAVFAGGDDKHAPEIRITSKWVHLTWREGPPSNQSYFRGLLGLAGLTEEWGPEPLLTSDDDGLVPPEGESIPGSSPEPPADHLFTPRTFLPMVPGEPGKLYLWGVLDDLEPIGYSQGFRLPSGVRGSDNLRARWIGGRMLVSFEDSEHFYYTMRKNGAWTDIRVVELDQTTTAASAQLEVEDMIRRETGATSDCPAD